MKALIVVLLISSLPSLAQARQGSCIAANETDITNTYQENVTVKEGYTVRCWIYYEWDAEKEECVTKRYGSDSTSYPETSPDCYSAISIRDSIYCGCSFTNCNADLRPFTEVLEAFKTKAENEDTKLYGISSRQIERQLIACMLEKSKAANGESTTIGDGPASTTEGGGDSMSTSDSPHDTEDTGVTTAMSTTTERTTTTSDVGTSAATEGGQSTSIEGGEDDTTKSEIPDETNENRNDTLSASTNTTVTVTTNPSSSLNNDEKSSTFLGLFIGSAVFNVLLVATIVALIVALVKMNKKLGEAKQGTAKVEKKVHQTPTAIQIETPVMNKDSPTVPPPAVTTKAADQPEAVADTTGTSLDLDTTGGTSGSDSTGTGPDGFNEVRVSVRGFSRN